MECDPIILRGRLDIAKRLSALVVIHSVDLRKTRNGASNVIRIG